MPGHHQPYGGGGVQGNLIGPNSAIFQGGGRGNLGPFGPGPMGAMGPGPLGPGGMHPDLMFHQPEGINDLHPDLPDDPMRIGGVRRPPRQMMQPPHGGMFGPNGNLGGFGPGPGGFGGGSGGAGGNMYM